MKKLLAIIITLALICASCATTTGSRYREGDNTGQQTNLTVADEERLANEALPKLQKDYPAANNPELQRYVSQLGMNRQG